MTDIISYEDALIQPLREWMKERPVYDQKAINALANLTLDAVITSMRPLPARRIFASYWRVLHVDGFEHARDRKLFWWPTQYVSAEDLKMVYGEPAAAKESAPWPLVVDEPFV